MSTLAHWFMPFSNLYLNILFLFFVAWFFYALFINFYRMYKAKMEIRKLDRELVVLRKNLAASQAKIKESLRQLK